MWEVASEEAEIKLQFGPQQQQMMPLVCSLINCGGENPPETNTCLWVYCVMP